MAGIAVMSFHHTVEIEQVIYVTLGRDNCSYSTMTPPNSQHAVSGIIPRAPPVPFTVFPKV